MKLTIHRKRFGFTLIEMTIGLMIGLSTGVMILAMFNQQLAFLKIFRAQTFLTEEAPIVSMYVSRLIGKADRFRLHANVANALAGTNPRLTASPVVVLNYKQPDGSMRATILSYETRNGVRALWYYVVPVNGVLPPPEWSVTRAPTDVSFSVDTGVLRMTLTGPNGELITYSGTMQQ
jgi:hypothetical protein